MTSPEQVPVNETRTDVRDDIREALAEAQNRTPEVFRLPDGSMERVASWLSKAQTGWDQYPDSQNAVKAMLAHPRSIEQLRYLDRAFMAISTTQVAVNGEVGNPVTPKGTSLAETMGLVLVPWRRLHDAFIEDSGSDPVIQLKKIRAGQGGLRVDEGYAGIVDMFRNNSLQYLNPRARSHSESEWIDARTYLNDRVAEVTTSTGEGGWGVMLMQVGSDVGLEGDAMQQPDYNEDGQAVGHLMAPNALSGAALAGLPIASCGPFETLALSMQVPDPRELFSEYHTAIDVGPVTEYMPPCRAVYQSESWSWSTMPYLARDGGHLQWGDETAEYSSLDVCFRIGVV